MKQTIDNLAQRENHIFDIDDCLFPRTNGLHADIKHRIADRFNAATKNNAPIRTTFESIVTNLGRQNDFDINDIKPSDLEAAFLPMITTLRLHYSFKKDDKYGSDKFLDMVDQHYDVDYSVIKPDPTLVDAFKQAKDKGIELYLYTNGASHPQIGEQLHAQRVLKALGFDNEWVEFLRKRTHDLLKSEKLGNGKPYPSSFAQMLNGFGLDPRDTVFYDDTVGNIKTANDFGVATVWPWTTDEAAPAELETIAESINAYKTRDTAKTFSDVVAKFSPN